ncbi:MAG TPA: Gfo/Idh/MocA family oxidoreductase [Chthonomonadales bacterium]|nr:Gfo/Idh/MocA family oxidoreductase [Chthonomonadales bacterium]
MERREFLKRTAAAGAVLAAGPARAAGARGQANRVNIAVIGCGGMGNAQLDTLIRLRAEGLVNIVAVCDVYHPRRDAAAAKSGGKPYTDYRRLLEDQSIDAVAIATPDHWHARMTIDAAEAGKDVYCEKPMTHWRNLREPHDVMRAIARHRRVMQVGTQGMSGDIWERCHERIRAGALGKLIHAQASDCRNGHIGLYSPKSVDPGVRPGVNLDWDMFLGPAPRRPYEPGRFMAFRSFLDYSGGAATDFFPHILTPLLRTMGLGFPKRVTCSGGRYFWDDGREIPDIVNTVIEYPEGPSVLLIASLATETNLPMLIRGQEATLTFGGPGAIIDPQPSVPTGRPREEVAAARGATLDEHFRDFLACVRSRERPRSHEVLGCQVMMAINMGVHAFMTGRSMEYDEATGRARFV